MLSDPEMFSLAALCTVVLSLLVAGYLHASLRKVLVDLCGSADRARFWTSFAHVMFVLVPLATTMAGRSARVSTDSVFFAFVDHVKWGVVGLIVSVVVIALGVVAFVGSDRGSTIAVSPTQADDLRQLLARVQELRARELVRKSPASPEQPA